MRLPEIIEERTLEARTLEQRQASAGPVELSGLPVPGKAAMFSLFPGLGQLYNGETGKGLLFLAVSISNLILLSLLFYTGPVLQGFADTAGFFNFRSSLDISNAAGIVRNGPLAVTIYAGLILAFTSYAMREAYDHALSIRRGRTMPRFQLTMPESTSGSYLFHFASLLTMVLLVVLYAAPPIPREQTTTIELVQPPEPPKPPEPEKPKPEPPKPVETPKVQPKQVKPPEPKPTPVAVAVPSNEPSPFVQSNEPAPEEPPAQPSTAGTPGGDAGGGGGEGDGEDMDFSSYLAEVQKRVKKTWFPPRGNESKTVTCKFKIKRDGSLGTIKLVASSGLAIVDEAAKTAVRNAAPYPPLPAGSPDEVDIKFTFDYNVFNGRGGG